MTTYGDRKMRCAVCGKVTRQRVLTSTNAMGPADLDMRPSEMQRSTMDAWVYRCPACAYCNADLEQAVPGAVELVRSEPYRSIVDEPTLPALARSFRGMATVLEASHPLDAAHAHLHAAWVCDDHDRPEQAVACRERAIECFIKARPFGENEHAVDHALILVDVTRRTGRFEEAGAEARATRSMTGLDEVRTRMLDIQESLIVARDAGAYTVTGETRPELETREMREYAERADEARAGEIEREEVITSRRCPECGKPCPKYRKTCKYCGALVGRER